MHDWVLEWESNRNMQKNTDYFQQTFQKYPDLTMQSSWPHSKTSSCFWKQAIVIWIKHCQQMMYVRKFAKKKQTNYKTNSKYGTFELSHKPAIWRFLMKIALIYTTKKLDAKIPNFIIKDLEVRHKINWLDKKLTTIKM